MPLFNNIVTPYKARAQFVCRALEKSKCCILVNVDMTFIEQIVDIQCPRIQISM